MLCYGDIPKHTDDLLDLTSLTVEEFEALVPPFQEAFLRYMAEWTLHGRRRQFRRYTTYKNCPLPTPEDRLLFILVYLKQNPTQTFHGRVFGMRQSKANQWIHVLLPVLRDTLRALGDTPSRNLEDLSQRLGVELSILESEPSLLEETEGALESPVPLFVMTGPNDPYRAPKTKMNRKLIIAARKSVI